MRTRLMMLTTAVFATVLAASAAVVPAQATNAADAAFCRAHRATIVGTNGDDNLVGTSGRDVIVGLGGKDTINGLGGDDWLCGGNGNDAINGGRGDDHAYGEAHFDTLVWSRGDDVIDGGYSKFQNLDKLIDTAAPQAIAMDLRTGSTRVGRHQHDTVTNMEWIELSRFDDVFDGTAADETVFAGRGDDKISTSRRP